MDSKYVDKYWEHRDTVLEALEYYVDLISGVVAKEEIRNNSQVQKDLTNAIFSILEVIKEIQSQRANPDYRALSEVVERNKEIIFKAIQSNLQNLDRLTAFLSENIPKGPKMELLDAQKNRLTLAQRQLFEADRPDKKEVTN